jgi:integrase
MAIIDLPSGRFRVQIRRKNMRVDEVFDTRTEAEDAQTRYLGKTPQRKGGKITVAAAWNLYHADRDFLEKKASTRSGEETHVKPALTALGARPARSIEPDDIESFIRDELRTGKAADTIRNEVAALSAVLNYCVRKRFIPRNACIGVRRPTAEPKMRRMQPSDEGALMLLLKHARFRYRSTARLCLLVRETGARPGEWRATRWSDINLEKHRVTFPNTKYKRQPRTIPLTEAALTLLTAQLEDVAIRNLELFGESEYIFPAVAKSGEIVPLQYSGTVRDLKKDKLLPLGFRPHNGRHEFITKLVEDSDLEDSRIMALVGHHSPTSMQIYTHARAVRLRPHLEALEDDRRQERTRSVSNAIGVPSTLVQSYLVHRRDQDGGEGQRNELLFDEQTIADLQRAASKLGTTPEARIATLLRIARQRATGAPANASGVHHTSRRSSRPARPKA